VWIGRIMIALIVIYMAYKRIAGTFKI
jgi:hypothetical protein